MKITELGQSAIVAAKVMIVQIDVNPRATVVEPTSHYSSSSTARRSFSAILIEFGDDL